MAKENGASTPDVTAKNAAAKPKKAEKDSKGMKSPKDLFKKVSQFFRELKSEFKKIVWPTKKQVINSTLIVLGVVLVMGVGIWILDFLFIQGFALLF